MVERLARRSRVHASVSVEAEQRGARIHRSACDPTTFDLLGEQLGHARPVWDESALSELATAHDEKLPFDVYVADSKATCLAGS